MRLLGGEDDVPEIVALRALKLGDLLVAVPAIHGLRRAFPAHRLVLAVPGWLEPVVELIGGVDAILPTPGLDAPLPLRPGRVDLAVNLHGNGPESRAVIDALAARRVIAHRVAGHDDPAAPAWVDGMHERERWARLVRAFGIPAHADDLGLLRPLVEPTATGATVVHVGAFYGARQWPVERFGAVARALAARGHEVRLTGSAAERERAEAAAGAAGLPRSTVLAGELDLAGFAAVICDAALVVTADTGAAHLASAYGVPSVVIFGPAPPEEWGPPASGPHRVLTHAELRVGATFSSEPDPALLAVTVDEVLEAAVALEGVPPRRPRVGV